MKIIHTPARFTPYCGGVECLVLMLSKKLAKEGNQVTVICANEPVLKKNDSINGIKIKRLDYVGKIANTNITLELPFVLLAEDFDIIHTHIPTPWSADWSAIVSLIKGKPLWVTYHNDIVGKGCYSCIAKIYNATMLKIVLWRAEKIFVTQEANKEWKSLSKYKDKIVVQAPIIDTNRFKPLNDGWKGKNTVAFLSVLDEFHKYKGLDILLKAIAQTKKKIPSIKLRVGGNGSLLPFYKKMAIELGIEKNVEFLGFIPEEKLVEFYNHCNVFVLPSTDAKQEGYGIVAAEALACGKKIIVSDIIGIAKEKNEKIERIKTNDEKELSRELYLAGK